jgi:hypothetical protein
VKLNLNSLLRSPPMHGHVRHRACSTPSSTSSGWMCSSPAKLTKGAQSAMKGVFEGMQGVWNCVVHTWEIHDDPLLRPTHPRAPWHMHCPPQTCLEESWPMPNCAMLMFRSSFCIKMQNANSDPPHRCINPESSSMACCGYTTHRRMNEWTMMARADS